MIALLQSVSLKVFNGNMRPFIKLFNKKAPARVRPQQTTEYKVSISGVLVA